MHRLLPVALTCSLLGLAACEVEGEDTEAVVYGDDFEVDPGVGGIGTQLRVVVNSEDSQFVFGATDLDFGEDILVDNVTVKDGFTVIADLTIADSAVLGDRDVLIDIDGRSETIADGFEVVEDSFWIDPDSAKLGETIDVQIVGSNTEWTDGHTWTSFGTGVSVLDVSVISETLVEATIAVEDDAQPGSRDVHMETGPKVTTLYDGFVVDRAALTAEFDPPQAYQGETVEFTLIGVDTAWDEDIEISFWDDGGENPDIEIDSITLLDGENLYGKMTLSNAADLGYRDVLVDDGTETIIIPNAVEVLDAEPDLSRVAIGLGFDVSRVQDNSTGDIAESVSAIAYFIIPLDPPCGSSSSGSGPSPYDVNGVFPSPPEAEEEDCPNPETVSAGDHVYFESDTNVVTLDKDVITSTGQILYRGYDLTLDDYAFGEIYDLHTEGDPDYIGEYVLEEVQPTVPADFEMIDPQFWGDLTISRAEEFCYEWTPAETYPDAFFGTGIYGTLVSTGEGGFAASLPWDDGEHCYTADELSELEAGPVSWQAYSYIEGREFGFPFSIYQSNQSDSTLSLSASLYLE